VEKAGYLQPVLCKIQNPGNSIGEAGCSRSKEKLGEFSQIEEIEDEK